MTQKRRPRRDGDGDKGGLWGGFICWCSISSHAPSTAIPPTLWCLRTEYTWAWQLLSRVDKAANWGTSRDLKTIVLAILQSHKICLINWFRSLDLKFTQRKKLVRYDEVQYQNHMFSILFSSLYFCFWEFLTLLSITFISKFIIQIN